MKIGEHWFDGSHKTGSIKGLMEADITKKLGLNPQRHGVNDGDGKVAYEWSFTADGEECAIWEWKGGGRSGFHSAYGPSHVLRQIFGPNYKDGHL